MTTTHHEDAIAHLDKIEANIEKLKAMLDAKDKEIEVLKLALRTAVHDAMEAESNDP